VSPTRSRVRLGALAILLTTAGAVYALDHLIKWVVEQHVAYQTQVPSSGPVTIDHVHNTGAAFGLFPQLQTVFLVVAVLVSGYIVLAGHRFGSGLSTQLPLGLVLGGATANAVDRFRQGYVVDYIDLHRWPVFNLADMCIVVGIVAALFFVVPRAEGPRGDAAIPPGSEG